MFMLKHVSIGLAPREHALVVTPEFFDEAQCLAKSTWAVCVRLWWYPRIRNWVLLRGVIGPPPETRSFDLGDISIFIPIKQLELFEGRVLGYETCIPGLPLLGFLEDTEHFTHASH